MNAGDRRRPKATGGPLRGRRSPRAEAREASFGEQLPAAPGSTSPSGGRVAANAAGAAVPSTRHVRVSVAWASPRAQGVVEVDLPPGSTLADAVSASGALERAGVEPAKAGYAIFGQTARPGTPLADGDRVEITRPLVADPKAVRRDRAAANPLPPARSGRKRPASR